MGDDVTIRRLDEPGYVRVHGNITHRAISSARHVDVTAYFVY